MRKTNNDIRERLLALEKKLDLSDCEQSQGTKQIFDLAEEFRKIMKDYHNSLLDNDLDFLMR